MRSKSKQRRVRVDHAEQRGSLQHVELPYDRGLSRSSRSSRRDRTSCRVGLCRSPSPATAAGRGGASDIEVGWFADRIAGRVELVDHPNVGHEFRKSSTRRVAADASVATNGALRHAERHAVVAELQARPLAVAQLERAWRLAALARAPTWGRTWTTSFRRAVWPGWKRSSTPRCAGTDADLGDQAHSSRALEREQARLESRARRARAGVRTQRRLAVMRSRLAGLRTGFKKSRGVRAPDQLAVRGPGAARTPARL